MYVNIYRIFLNSINLQILKFFNKIFITISINFSVANNFLNFLYKIFLN